MTYWAAILLGGAATYLVRALPLVVALRADGSPALRRYLDALPVAIIAALAGAGITVPDGVPTGGAEIAAGAAVVGVAAWRRSLLPAMIAGVVLAALLRSTGL